MFFILNARYRANAQSTAKLNKNTKTRVNEILLVTNNIPYPINNEVNNQKVINTANNIHRFSMSGITLSPANFDSNRIIVNRVLITDILADRRSSACFNTSILFA
jgi:hypothetical protein